MSNLNPNSEHPNPPLSIEKTHQLIEPGGIINRHTSPRKELLPDYKLVDMNHKFRQAQADLQDPRSDPAKKWLQMQGEQFAEMTRASGGAKEEKGGEKVQARGK